MNVARLIALRSGHRHRPRHVDRPSMLVRPDDDRDRRQADHRRRQDICVAGGIESIESQRQRQAFIEPMPS